jgi:4-amino-4-deoxy-L-arabinose transferase-like glycosyltransferase
LIPARLSLVLILAMQAIVSLTTLHNTAFQDEALYLYAGRQIIRNWTGGPPPLDHYANYFSGYPDVYPVIGGFLDRVGGLELARSFSLLCMLVVTAMVWYITRRLFDVPAAIFASASYAVMGVVLFLSRLATFDAMCLSLIALATAVAVHCGTTARPWSAFLVGPILVLAILTKYAALLFVPATLAILAVLSMMFVGWKRASLRLLYTLVGLGVSLWVAYLRIDPQAFHALAGSTTNRQTGLKDTRIDLFTHVMRMGGIVFAIALVGVLLLIRSRRFVLFGLALFGASWLAPLYHIYKQEPISLDKHIAYGLFFAAPLAGYALAWISGYEGPAESTTRRGYWLVGGLVVLALFTLGLRQSQDLFANWANTSQLSYALHTQLRDGTGRILAEDIEVSRFDARDVTQEWQWTNFYYPYYIDKNNQLIDGQPGLIAGLNNRFYDLVELSFNYIPDTAYFVASQMASDHNYDLIARVPFSNSYGKGHFFLFRSALVPGQGNFTSTNQLKMTVWP